MTTHYQHILVAVDINDSDLEVLITARCMADRLACRLSAVHVCEHHVTGYGDTTAQNHIANDMQEKQQAYPLFKALLERAAIDEGHAQLLVGRPADSIHQYAEQQNCDLIVVGSHGYSGVKALLGSTAHKIVHGAQCDIYTVRIQD